MSLTKHIMIIHPRNYVEVNPQHAEIDCMDVSDGYHTMHELYRHRMALFCALCNIIADMENHPSFKVWKSKLHSDGTIPFNDPEYFIAGIETSHGQITYHMKIEKWWDEFRIPEYEKAMPYDGHTSNDVIERLLKL